MERTYIHNLMIHTEPNLLKGNEVNHKNKIFTIYLLYFKIIFQKPLFKNFTTREKDQQNTENIHENTLINLEDQVHQLS